MRVAAYHSHLGGWEYLQVRKPEIWREIVAAITSIDSPEEMSECFGLLGWQSEKSSGGSDFLKQGVAVEAYFDNEPRAAYDCLAKHLALYVRHSIDVGVGILPMKSIQQKLLSNAPYYEAECRRLMRERRGLPRAPLVIVGIKC